MQREKSAGAIVFIAKNSRKYLVLHYSKKHWDFAKGHIEGIESEEQAMRRELFEETGIKNIKIIPRFKETIEYYFTENNSKIKKEVVFFLVESMQKRVILSEEHLDFAWLSFENALKKTTHKKAKQVLKKAHAFLERKE